MKIEGRMKTAYYVATVVGPPGLTCWKEEAAYWPRCGIEDRAGQASHRASNAAFFAAPRTWSGLDHKYVGWVRCGGEAAPCPENRFYWDS